LDDVEEDDVMIKMKNGKSVINKKKVECYKRKKINDGVGKKCVKEIRKNSKKKRD
jgi:hypothetical protein